MDPVLPADIGRVLSDYERRIKDLENRRYRPTDRLSDLWDVSIDQSGGPWAPGEGDALVWDPELGTTASPEGRWRPGESGGGGGSSPGSVLIWQMDENRVPWVVVQDASDPGLLLGVLTSGGDRGITVPESGVYAFTATVTGESPGDVTVRLDGPRVQGPIETCIYQLVEDAGDRAASVAADFACPPASNVTVTVDAPGVDYWTVHMTAHLVRLVDVLDGDCGA